MPRILSVEDDCELQQLLSLSLIAEGFDVHYAFTGPEGYVKALQLNPDLLLCDMMLPGLGGLEVIARLRALETVRRIPVILTSSYFPLPDLEQPEFRSLGIVECVQKPLRMAVLLKLIHRLVDGQPDRPLPALLRRGRFALDPDFRCVWRDNQLAATLTPKRFEALRLLFEAPGAVPRAGLVRALWGEAGTEENLEKTIQRLRQDLGKNSALIRTTAEGYEFATSPLE